MEEHVDRTKPAGRATLVDGSLSSLEHVSTMALRKLASGVFAVASINPKERDSVIALTSSMARSETSSSFPLRISKRMVSHIDTA